MTDFQPLSANVLVMEVEGIHYGWFCGKIFRGSVVDGKFVINETDPDLDDKADAKIRELFLTQTPAT